MTAFEINLLQIGLACASRTRTPPSISLRRAAKEERPVRAAHQVRVAIGMQEALQVPWARAWAGRLRLAERGAPSSAEVVATICR